MTRILSVIATALLIVCSAQPQAEINRPYIQNKKQILFLGGSQYYAHDAVSRAMYTMAKLGNESGLFDVRFRTDFRLVTGKDIPQYKNAKNLEFFDAIMLFTQGDLPLTPDQKRDFEAFLKDDGKGLLVAHSGSDFNLWSFQDEDHMKLESPNEWPELIDIVGGVFVNHPWRQNVSVNVEDKQFPAMAHFPARFEIVEEIYQHSHLSRDNVRVLMSLDTSSVNLENPPLAPILREDLDFPLAWAHEYGKGRVFVSPLGHVIGSWDREDIQTMWLEAAKWVLGLTEADVSPNPVHPSSKQ
jgi:type 1 glutamine amidotransferase